ncbi:MAG: type IV conjugative transfer system protein TraL [Legionellaceae bacterium]|nr:type IV conjugative transfer system protein TraL [Legionellaceae bacterium]
MDNGALYRVISSLDEPKRYMSLTIDELLIAALGLMLLVTSNHKLLVGALGFGLYTFLKHLKQGHGPRFLLIQLYWHMPDPISKIAVSNLPPSYYRVWRG